LFGNERIEELSRKFSEVEKTLASVRQEIGAVKAENVTLKGRRD
jgi:uncharacterized coiled-coil DUF342 family protein